MAEAIMKKKIKVHYGFVHILRENLEAVMRKSGLNNFILQETFRNEKFSIIRLKEAPTLENARRVCKHLAAHAFGVVLTETGFAVRVKVEDKALAYCLYNEALTDVCGAQLIGLAKADSLYFEVHGVPAHMTDVNLATALSLARVGQKEWKCHPETRLGPVRQGFKIILVKAESEPPRCTVKVKLDNEMVLLQIEPHALKHRDMTVMQKAQAIVSKKVDKQTSFAAVLLRFCSRDFTIAMAISPGTGPPEPQI